MIKMKKGVTLIEIVVSMFIIGILAAGIYATFAVVGKGSGKTGTLDLHAVNYARETLEGLKNAVSTATDEGKKGAPLKDTESKQNVPTEYEAPLPAGLLRDKYNGTRKYYVDDVDENEDGVIDYKKVTVVVQWEDQ